MMERKIVSYIFVLTGFFLIVNSYTGMTGNVIGISLDENLWGFVAFFLIVGGIIIGMSGETKTKERSGRLEIILADDSKGENTNPDRDFVMIDNDGAFGHQSGRVTLGQVKRELHHLKRTNEEYRGVVSDTYVPKLEDAYRHAGNEKVRRIAAEFLRAFGREVKDKPDDEPYQKEEGDLSKKEILRIRSAFRVWSGKPTGQQREILREYGLVYDLNFKSKHATIVANDGVYVTLSRHTPSDMNAGDNVGRDVIKLINGTKKPNRK